MLACLIRLILFTFLFSIPCSIGWSEVNPKLKEAQEILSEMGYKVGPSDGLWGKKTDTALQQLYKSNNSVFVDNFKPFTHKELSPLLYFKASLLFIVVSIAKV